MPIPTELESWRALQAHANHMRDVHLRDLFSEDSTRAKKFSIECDGLYLDYSKQRVSERTRELLLKLAKDAGVSQAIQAMFEGQALNISEARPVLHTALRSRAKSPLKIAGFDVRQEIARSQNSLRDFTDGIRKVTITGSSKKPITDIVHIGIGGSVLGPQLVYEALLPLKKISPRVHFASNIDAHSLDSVLSELNPESTLFVVASKSFSTEETLLNAKSARKWLEQGLAVDTKKAGEHFVAVTANTKAALAFGIPENRVFSFWDWVGGRFSLWSAVSLSLVCSLGDEVFSELLAGANAMDEHFQKSSLDVNLPVLLALIGIWNRNFFGFPSYALVPYAHRLRHLPEYLQQLEMESNGKSIDREGHAIQHYQTAPVVWGAPGTDAQHSFFQLLHQGTEVIPCEFIACLHDEQSPRENQQRLLANCFAQSAALMLGKQADDPTKSFAGNRPSTTIAMERLNARSLGALLALYEHKVFVQGVIWNINSFDQEGVQYGKELAQTLVQKLSSDSSRNDLDSSTQALLEKI